jgi:hypothetical protein
LRKVISARPRCHRIASHGRHADISRLNVNVAPYRRYTFIPSFLCCSHCACAVLPIHSFTDVASHLSSRCYCASRASCSLGSRLQRPAASRSLPPANCRVATDDNRRIHVT